MYLNLNHPNILKAKRYFYLKDNSYIAIILDYYPEGNLSELIGSFSQNQSKNIIKKIAEGLTHIH